MPRLVLAVVVAGIAVFASAAEAWAGAITSASGPILVNGKPATLPVTLKKGDKVDTQNATANFRSDAGDSITLEKNTTAQSEGTEDGTEHFYVTSGVATGYLSEKTALGAPVAWATAPKGEKTQVRLEVPADRPSEGRFRTISGGTWLRSEPYRAWLPAAHSVTLWKDAKKSGSLCFRTSQQNENRVDIIKDVSGGAITARVPRATGGCYEDLTGNRTKISNEITSNKQDKIKIETSFGTTSSADIGPGTYAIIDNVTGAIEVIEEDVDSSIGEEIQTLDPVSGAADGSLTHKTKR